MDQLIASGQNQAYAKRPGLDRKYDFYFRRYQISHMEYVGYDIPMINNELNEIQQELNRVEPLYQALKQKEKVSLKQLMFEIKELQTLQKDDELLQVTLTLYELYDRKEDLIELYDRKNQTIGIALAYSDLPGRSIPNHITMISDHTLPSTFPFMIKCNEVKGTKSILLSYLLEQLYDYRNELVQEEVIPDSAPLNIIMYDRSCKVLRHFSHIGYTYPQTFPLPEPQTNTFKRTISVIDEFKGKKFKKST